MESGMKKKIAIGAIVIALVGYLIVSLSIRR